jgi:hypothetical protein
MLSARLWVLTVPDPLQIRSELAQKEIILLEKEVELLERDQTLVVLKEEVTPAACAT